MRREQAPLSKYKSWIFNYPDGKVGIVYALHISELHPKDCNFLGSASIGIWTEFIKT